MIAGVFVVIASDTVQTYHVAVTGYLGGGMVLTTSGVNSLIYSDSGARQAAGAGFILLSMVVVRNTCMRTRCSTNEFRSFGSSTLDLPHRPRRARSSTPSP